MNAAIVNSLNPAIIVVLSYALLRERLSKTNIAGFLLSLAGVLFILTDGHIAHVFRVNYPHLANA